MSFTLKTRPGEGGLLELLAPSPGFYRGGPAQGLLVSSGASAGELVVLGRARALVVPPDASGKVVFRAGEGFAEAAVSFGDVLLRVDPAGVGDVGEGATVTTSSAGEEGLVLRAPMGGRFYLRPSPDKPAFASVGEPVERGATLGLLEVMKTFHRLQFRGEGLPERAIVRAFLVEDGDDVERGQPVVAFEPS